MRRKCPFGEPIVAISGHNVCTQSAIRSYTSRNDSCIQYLVIASNRVFDLFQLQALSIEFNLSCASFTPKTFNVATWQNLSEVSHFVLLPSTRAETEALRAGLWPTEVATATDPWTSYADFAYISVFDGCAFVAKDSDSAIQDSPSNRCRRPTSWNLIIIVNSLRSANRSFSGTISIDRPSTCAPNVNQRGRGIACKKYRLQIGQRFKFASLKY